MNYYTYTYKTKDGEEKELRLRLTSGDTIEIENMKKTKFLDYIQEESMSMIITMLQYMRRFEDKNFSLKNATQLYDELIDSGMTMKSILIDIIYETLVVSGFLEKEDWEELKASLTQTKKQAKKDLLELI